MTLYSEPVPKMRAVLMCDKCAVTEKGNPGWTKKQLLEYFYGFGWKSYLNEGDQQMVLHLCEDCVYELKEEGWFEENGYVEVTNGQP